MAVRSLEDGLSIVPALTRWAGLSLLFGCAGSSVDSTNLAEAKASFDAHRQRPTAVRSFEIDLGTLPRMTALHVMTRDGPPSAVQTEDSQDCTPPDFVGWMSVDGAS